MKSRRRLCGTERESLGEIKRAKQKKLYSKKKKRP